MAADDTVPHTFAGPLVIASRKGWLPRVGISMAVAVAMAFATYLEWFERLDLLAYDWLIARNVRTASDQVVIVAVDERSLATLGPWAWPRSTHAQLVRRLKDAGARVVAFDVVFVGPDAGDPAADGLLAQAMKEHGRVVLPILPEQMQATGQVVEVLPPAPLMEAAAALAHVEVEQDLEGVVRRCFLKAGVAAPHWPALALAAVQLARPGTFSGVLAARAEKQRPPSPLAWVRDEMVLIPFARRPGHFPRVSYIDVLTNDFREDRFRDRVVLVGATASALGDMLLVPSGGPVRKMSGVELQANLADALIQGISLRPLGLLSTSAYAAMVILLAVLLYEVVRAAWLVFAVAMALVFLSIVFAMTAMGLWISPTTALIGLILSFALQVSLRLHADRTMLGREHERARAGLESIADSVIATDAAGAVTFMNPAAEDLTGFSFTEALGQHLSSVLPLHDALTDAPVDPRSVARNGASRGKAAWEAIVKSRTGGIRSVRGTIAELGTSASHGGGTVLALSDVTDVNRLARSIEYQATHDALTDLPSRKLFEQALDHAVAAAIRDRGLLTLLLVDIDQLGIIGDTLGREATNAALRIAAARLAGCLRQPGMVARTGEHRFAIFFAALAHRDTATFLSHQIRRTLAQPFDIGGFEQCMSASIGVSSFPRDANDRESLFIAAEGALNRAKQQGGNRIQYAVEASQPAASKRQRIRNSLRQAIENDEMALHYQPQLDLNDGLVSGVEALLRWSSPGGRLHSPPDVVAVAEELGLVDELNCWVLRTACREVASAAKAAETAPIRVSVNLTADQFLNPKLPAMVKDALAVPEAPAVHLALEITEETLIRDMDVARQSMERIREMGVDLFVDDFGVGYASLVYLKKMPLTGLKINKSYVHDALLEPEGAAIVRAIVVLAHSMRLRVIAEGVESGQQFGFLRSESCDEVQGYLISRPLPSVRLVSWLRSNVRAKDGALLERYAK